MATSKNSAPGIPYSLLIGIYIPSCPDLYTVFQKTPWNYQFVAVHIANPHNYRSPLHADSSLPLTRSDTLLTTSQWACVFGVIDDNYIDCDNKNKVIRERSAHMLRTQLEFALHLNLFGILLPPVTLNCVNFASVVNEVCGKRADIAIRCCIDKEGWEAYKRLVKLCEGNTPLKVCLQIPSDLPDEEDIERWRGENLGCLFISSNIFLTNEQGSPVLSKRHQRTILSLFVLCSTILISTEDKEDSNSYQAYIQDLFQSQAPYTPSDLLEYGYLDLLQSPLQPLADNLESRTYEVFERDEAKYILYEQALVKAFAHIKALRNSTNMGEYEMEGRDMKILPKENMKLNISVAYVGAGRGPLLRRASEAAEEVGGINLELLAIEKNPNAIVTLRNMKREQHMDNLQIYETDMREWGLTPNTQDIKVDLVVSELLGSFGDNELSPECLDGAKRILKEGGIYIPSSYTSYIQPISSYLLWKKLKNSCSSFHIPYVTKFKSVILIDAPKPLFTFLHPRPKTLIQGDNSRYEVLKFISHKELYIHGFAGYFDTTLFADLHISISPLNPTPQMHSWFPMYFPIDEEIKVMPGEEIEVHFWRCCTTAKVWYEWCAIVGNHATQIHNAKGMSYYIGKY